MMLFKNAKRHYTWHMSKKFRFLNPKLTSTFKGEDYVGQISVMGHNWSMGESRLQVASVLAEKYREHMHHRLTRGDFLDTIKDSFLLKTACLTFSEGKSAKGKVPIAHASLCTVYA